MLRPVLAQSTDARGRDSKNNANGHCSSADFEDLARTGLAGLAPDGAGERGIQAALVPESRFGAADAAMPGLDGKAGAAVPLNCCAGVVGRRPLASELQEAPAIACALVVERLGELALVVERPPVATIMNRIAEEDFGPTLFIEIRDFAGRDELQQRSGDHLGNRWAT